MALGGFDRYDFADKVSSQPSRYHSLFGALQHNYLNDQERNE